MGDGQPGNLRAPEGGKQKITGRRISGLAKGTKRWHSINCGNGRTRLGSSQSTPGHPDEKRRVDKKDGYGVRRHREPRRKDASRRNGAGANSRRLKKILRETCQDLKGRRRGEKERGLTDKEKVWSDRTTKSKSLTAITQVKKL